MKTKINKLQYTDNGNFLLIAGPCVIESEEMVFKIARKIQSICNKLEIPYILKGSYRKANRSRVDSFTGIGDENALKILKKVGDSLNIPTLTDIHTKEEAEFVDVLQIPSFLCRQTDLLVAAAKTGKTINIKKGQFLSAEVMIHAVEKVRRNGNNNIKTTERGTMFGYQDLIIDFRGITTMKKMGTSVIVDVTHSNQKPNQINGITSGNTEMIETLAKAAIATGSDGLFIETHPNPTLAKSDGSNMLSLHKLEELLEKLVKIRKAI